MLKNYNVVITGGNAVNKKSRKKSILEIIPEHYGSMIFYIREEQPSREEIADWILSICNFFNSNKYVEIEDLKYGVEEEIAITSRTLKFYYETLTPQDYFKIEEEARKYKDYKFEEKER